MYVPTGPLVAGEREGGGYTPGNPRDNIHAHVHVQYKHGHIHYMYTHTRTYTMYMCMYRYMYAGTFKNTYRNL